MALNKHYIIEAFDFNNIDNNQDNIASTLNNEAFLPCIIKNNLQTLVDNKVLKCTIDNNTYTYSYSYRIEYDTYRLLLVNWESLEYEVTLTYGSPIPYSNNIGFIECLKNASLMLLNSPAIFKNNSINQIYATDNIADFYKIVKILKINVTNSPYYYKCSKNIIYTNTFSLDELKTLIHNCTSYNIELLFMVDNIIYRTGFFNNLLYLHDKNNKSLIDVDYITGLDISKAYDILDANDISIPSYKQIKNIFLNIIADNIPSFKEHIAYEWRIYAYIALMFLKSIGNLKTLYNYEFNKTSIDDINNSIKYLNRFYPSSDDTILYVKAMLQVIIDIISKHFKN